jgi:hypothetical protein
VYVCVDARLNFAIERVQSSASQPFGRGVTFLNKSDFLRHLNCIFKSLAVTTIKISNSPRHPNLFLRHSGWEALFQSIGCRSAKRLQILSQVETEFY